MEGALLRAALEASCLRGALPPVDLRAAVEIKSVKRIYQKCRKEVMTYSAWCGPLLLCVMMELMGLFVGDDVLVG